MAYRRVTSQTLLGAAVVLLGLALLLDSTGAYDTGALLQYVPSLFVLVGVYAIVASRFQNLFGPLVIVVVAGTAQLVALDYVQPDQLAQYWPVLVVAFGLSVLLGRFRARSAADDSSYLDAFALFGGVDRRVTSRTFVGATLTALFGGVELDLRDAVVAEKPARVNATALFGGVEVVVPRDWNVEFDVLPILAGASDDRPRRDGETTHDETDLVLTGFTAFGGIGVSD